ncbi:M20 aminoacylase family protein [Bradyrhizobium sp. NP1]|uniref:M20 aminoacylase family protein n=1 Tax=Bradyrhizobium sp. NP1 TaxID=3049772 RepID=UPI0025A6241D|nr:M20 aminoacylase family protein [Bradyrhizobium sp. NP1]WJR81895.1 M20 aminoacylase family protein [Bradyrhizobium sp. NP1]
MAILDRVMRYQNELTEIRRDLHANPELGFDTQRTAGIVAKELAAYGLEVHTSIGGTGVVGVLRAGSSSRSTGLRADMDALPIQEESGRPYASQAPGTMHACGHDGHTACLLGAARYLAHSKNFDGTINFIFQPAEEIFGGAKAMIDDGLFDRFPCGSVFGIHNRPGLEVGKYVIRPGAMMAGGASFAIDIVGKGSHGARPEASIDPVLSAAHITVSLQAIVARNISPVEAAVLSVTQISAGDAFNVIPRTARLGGTVRAFSTGVIDTIEERMNAIVKSVASAFGATASIDFQRLVPPLVNDANATDVLIQAAASLVGAENVSSSGPLLMASEDFSYMLERCPGAFMNVGIARGEAGAALLHTPAYDFNDEAIPYGAALFAGVAERMLAPN